MPVVSDRHGRLARVPETWFFAERPRDFLSTTCYVDRLKVARRIILTVVVSQGRDSRPNDTLKLSSDQPADLADFIDRIDGNKSRRARLVSADQHAQSFARSYRIRSPQQMSHRRRRLFSLDDIEGSWLFYDPVSRQNREYEPFLDLMRWHLIHDAINAMIDQGELWHMHGMWQVRPSVIDQHRECGRRSRKRSVKHDDRSFHGRPNRDRQRSAA